MEDQTTVPGLLEAVHYPGNQEDTFPTAKKKNDLIKKQPKDLN